MIQSIFIGQFMIFSQFYFFKVNFLLEMLYFIFIYFWHVPVFSLLKHVCFLQPCCPLYKIVVKISITVGPVTRLLLNHCNPVVRRGVYCFPSESYWISGVTRCYKDDIRCVLYSFSLQAVKHELFSGHSGFNSSVNLKDSQLWRGKGKMCAV